MREPYLYRVGGLSLLLGAGLVLAGAGCSMPSGSQGAGMGGGPAGPAVLPDFTLKDYNGEEHSLAGLKGKLVVLDFCSIECPYSRGVDESLPQLASSYGEKGVVFLGIDSNVNQTPEQIKGYAAEKKIPYPILKDEASKYADAVGATRTPEFYVLDKDQKVVYHGAYDDRKVPEKAGDANYIREALDAVLAGQPVKTAAVAAWGCSIKRK